MNDILQFSFPESASREEVEQDIALAMYTAECIHGRPQTRMDTSYFVSSSGRRCVMAVRGTAGESAARVFTGLCEDRFGPEGFSVRRSNPHE